MSRSKQWAAGVVYRVLHTAVSLVAGAIALVLSAFIQARRRERGMPQAPFGLELTP